MTYQKILCHVMAGFIILYPLSDREISSEELVKYNKFVGLGIEMFKNQRVDTPPANPFRLEWQNDYSNSDNNDNDNHNYNNIYNPR